MQWGSLGPVSLEAAVTLPSLTPFANVAWAGGRAGMGELPLTEEPRSAPPSPSIDPAPAPALPSISASGPTQLPRWGAGGCCLSPLEIRHLGPEEEEWWRCVACVSRP